MTGLLVVIAEQRIMGEIRRARGGRLSFAYDDRWRSMRDAYPLSLSMPLAVAEHEHARIEPWLRGLLPDNDNILRRWGQRFGVSPRNTFSLLAWVGEDCPGAIQLVRPDRVDDVLRDDERQIEWLTEADIAKRLRTLKQDGSAWRLTGDVGHFSLAGAQPKTALFFDGQRWGVPAGSTPTTHILKPPVDGLDGHVENEHLCLTLAREFGLPAARSEVQTFGDETAIVIERYDRIPTDGRIRRLHQEDMCQLLGFSPALKYEADGGPGCRGIFEAIRTYSQEPVVDAWSFAEALMLNWVIGGTDAHAKNFSMLIGAQETGRLAPLYDMASALPYDFDLKRLRMAFRIGGKYRLDDILARHWTKFATEAGLPAAEVLEMGTNMAGMLPGALNEAVTDVRAKGLCHPILERMVEVLNARAGYCARILAAAVPETKQDRDGGGNAPGTPEFG